jgi:hypothetical protein
MVSNFRIAATSATFFGVPVITKREQNETRTGLWRTAAGVAM